MDQGQPYSHIENARIHSVAVADSSTYHAVAIASGTVCTIYLYMTCKFMSFISLRF